MTVSSVADCQPTADACNLADYIYLVSPSFYHCRQQQSLQSISTVVTTVVLILMPNWVCTVSRSALFAVAIKIAYVSSVHIEQASRGLFFCQLFPTVQYPDSVYRIEAGRFDLNVCSLVRPGYQDLLFFGNLKKAS